MIEVYFRLELTHDDGFVDRQREKRFEDAVELWDYELRKHEPYNHMSSFKHPVIKLFCELWDDEKLGREPESTLLAEYRANATETPIYAPKM